MPKVITSQWLKTNWGLANPEVCLRISAENEKLSTTGSKAVMLKVDADPCVISELITLPCRLPSTAYILPLHNEVLTKYYNLC